MFKKTQKIYYIPDKAESLWYCKYKELFHSFKPVPPFPRYIQVQTITGCNASCTFCPHVKITNPFPKGKMVDELYRKIIDECVKKPVKRISPYLMNEPLLDRELGWKIKYIAERKSPLLFIKINTNASLLRGGIAEDIMNSGLDRLNISFHGNSKEVYEKSMRGLNYEQTLANVNHFLETKNKLNVLKPKVDVTMVRTKWIESEITTIRNYWSEKKVRVHIQPLENRANQQIQNRGLNLKEWRPYSWCKRLFTQAYILYNGDMVLCCVDWERTTVLGNVKEKSIEEVWNGEKAVSIRRTFLSGNTEGLLCHSCFKQLRD